VGFWQYYWEERKNKKIEGKDDMKKIALDLDGVVFDSENLYRVYAEMHDVDKFGRDNIIDNSPRLFQKRYDWPDEELKDFYKKNAPIVLSTANLMTGVELVLKKLMNNFEIIVITSRSEDETSYGLEKLKNVGIDNLKVFFNEHSKIERLKIEKCDYIIDDDIDICKNAAKENITGIYFKNAASDKVDDVRFFKVVNNWGEIYKFLILGDN